MKRIAIVGSRGFIDYISFSYIIDKYLYNCNRDQLTIVSGGAIGVDSLAEEYAKERNILFIKITPNYELLGKIAPFVRDKQIVNMVDSVIALWDYESRGTKLVIEYARKQKKNLRIIRVKTKKV